MVKYVSVNYAMRFSGPVTVLTAHRVRYGVGAPLHLPARASAPYKVAIIPRRFFQQLSPSFFPSVGVLCASGLRECHLGLDPRSPFLRQAHGPTDRHDGASEGKCLRLTAGCYSFELSAALSRPRPDCWSPHADDDGSR
jgi:hypothetical protein